jgi:cell division septal protein FtsQ
MPEFQPPKKRNNNKQGGRPPALPRQQWVNPEPVQSAKQAGQKPLPPLQTERSPQKRNRLGRSKKVRKSYVIHVTVVSALIMIVLVALSTTVMFNAESVVIKGESKYSAEEIMQAGGIEPGVNLIRFDVQGAQRRIKDSLVYLDSVVVRREFPSAITVTVVPAERVLSVTDENGEYLEVSRNGRIINNNGTSRPDGLVVSGFLPSEPQVGGYLDCGEAEQSELIFRVIALIEKHELYGVSRMDISDRFDVKLFVNDEERVEVKLGAPSQLDGKIALAANIITEEIESNERGVLRISSPRKGTFKPDLGNG